MNTKLILYEDSTLFEEIMSLKDDTTRDLYIVQHLEQGISIRPTVIKYPISKSTTFIFCANDCNFYNQYRDFGEIVFFWNYLLYYTIHKLDLSKLNKRETKFNKFLLIQNNRPKYHRRLIMKYLDEAGLLDISYYSWLIPCGKSRDEEWYNDDIQWTKETDSTKLPSEIANTSNHFKIQTIPTEYYNSFLNIVNETTHELTAFTEKTWRPLILGVPFLINGSKDIHKKLTECGFKLYDDIIDYTFDSESDDEDRIKMMVSAINELKNKDYNELYNIIKPKIRYNQNLCFSMIETNVGIPEINGVNLDMFWGDVVAESKSKLKNLKQILKIN